MGGTSCGSLRRRELVGNIDLHDALNEDPRRDDRFRIQFTQRDHLSHLRYGALCGGGHDRSEVARGLAIHKIAPAVALVGLDQREIRGDRIFEHVAAAIDDAGFLAFGEWCPIRSRSEECSDPGSGCPYALGEIALRHKLELDLARMIERVEDIRIGLPWKGTDDLAHPF